MPFYNLNKAYWTFIFPINDADYSASLPATSWHVTNRKVDDLHAPTHFHKYHVHKVLAYPIHGFSGYHHNPSSNAVSNVPTHLYPDRYMSSFRNCRKITQNTFENIKPFSHSPLYAMKRFLLNIIHIPHINDSANESTRQAGSLPYKTASHLQTCQYIIFYITGIWCLPYHEPAA